jgi:surface carbohydrate biosynthesis protein
MNFLDKFFFKNPKSVDIIIFDETNSHILEKIINQKYTFSIYKQRPAIFYVTLKVLLKFIINLKFLINHKLEKSSKKKFFSRILRTLNLIYIKSCIELIKPRAVITYIDNSSNFFWLSKHCKICPFIAFQNGMRLRYVKDDTKDFYLQHFFCWGENMVNLFKDYKYKVNNFYPVGSLAANIHFNFEKKNIDQFKYDLLIVSTWRGNIGWTKDVVDTMNSMKIMDKLLSKYISKKKIKAGIVLRSEINSSHFVMDGLGNEIDYYKEIYKDSAEIIKNNFKDRIIYKKIQNSNVIVSCLSSALLEAYGLGKKIMYFNFTKNNKYHCDLDRQIVSTLDDWNSFESLMDGIFAIRSKDYYSLHKKNMFRMMSFDKKINVIEKIQKKIDKIICDHI